MGRYILHVKNARAGEEWPFEKGGQRMRGRVEQVVVEAESGAAAREAYESERKAAGAVDTNEAPDAVGADQFQVMKVEALK